MQDKYISTPAECYVSAGVRSLDIRFSIDILLRWSKELIYCPNQDLQEGQDLQDKRDAAGEVRKPRQRQREEDMAFVGFRSGSTRPTKSDEISRLVKYKKLALKTGRGVGLGIPF